MLCDYLNVLLLTFLMPSQFSHLYNFGYANYIFQGLIRIQKHFHSPTLLHRIKLIWVWCKVAYTMYVKIIEIYHSKIFCIQSCLISVKL